MINILVTGANGFIGKATIKALSNNEDYHIFALDLLFEDTFQAKNITYISKDLLQKTFAYLSNLQIDIILHLAGNTNYELSDQNVVFMKNLLNLCINNRVKKFIFASTFQVYGENAHLNINETKIPIPINPYGISKYKCEQLLNAFSKHSSMICYVLRYFSVYGEQNKNGLMSLLAENYEKREITLSNDGNDIRDFVYIYDVVNANMLTIQSTLQNPYNIFNIGSGKGIKVSDVVNLFYNKENIKVNYGINKDEIRKISSDISYAQQQLSYNPLTCLSVGIARLKAYLNDNLHNN